MLQGNRPLSSGRWKLGQKGRRLGAAPRLRPGENLLSASVLARYIPDALDGLYPESWLEHRKGAEEQALQQNQEVQLTQLTLKLGLELSEYFLSNKENHQTVMQVNSIYHTLMTCLTALETHNRELTREIRHQLAQLPRPEENQPAPAAPQMILRAKEFKTYTQTKLQQLQQVFPEVTIQESHNYYGSPQPAYRELHSAAPTGQEGVTPAKLGETTSGTPAKTVKTVITAPPAWNWDLTAYRRQPQVPGGVAIHRQRLLKLLTKTTREEQESIWREIRTESELTQLCKRVEQRQESETSALVRLVQESDHKEYIRLIHTLEQRFVQQVSKGTSIHIQEESYIPSKARLTGRPLEEVALNEKQALVSRVQPVLVWLEQTLKAGKVRREKMLTRLEEQPQSLRQAFLTLAGDSGVFSEKSLPTRQQISAEERLTLLVRKSSRRELEQLLEWVREDPKAAFGRPGETKIVSLQQGQVLGQSDKKSHHSIPRQQEARDTEQHRPAPRTLVRFLEENPSVQLSQRTEPGSRRADLPEKREIRQLKGSLGQADFRSAEGEGAYPISAMEQAELHHRAAADQSQSEVEHRGQQPPKPLPVQAQASVPVQVQDTKGWEGTKLYSRTHYNEIYTTAQVIQEAQAVLERKSLLQHYHRDEQHIYHPQQQKNQPISPREAASPAASAVLLTSDTIRRWTEKHQFRRLMLEQTVLSRQYLLGQSSSDLVQPMQTGEPVVLRRPDSNTDIREGENGTARTVIQQTINLRKTEDSTYHSREDVFAVWTQELAHHKVTANRAVTEQLQNTLETVRTLRLLSRSDHHQEQSHHTKWMQQSTVARSLRLENETQVQNRRTFQQEEVFRTQKVELEGRQNIYKQENLLQRQTHTLEQDQFLHKKTNQLEQQNVLQQSRIEEKQQTLHTQTTRLEQQQDTLQRQTQTLAQEQTILRRTTREEEAQLLHRQEHAEHHEQVTTVHSRVTEEQKTLNHAILQEQRDTVLLTQKVRQETAVLGQVLEHVREKVKSTRQPDGVVIQQDATVGHQVLAKMVRDGEARILECQSERAQTQHRTIQKPGQAQPYPDHSQAGLELRREQKAEAVRETAAQAAKQAVEANIQKQSPDLRVLRRQSQEQEQVLRQQQEQIGGLRKQLEQQEALVRQSMERAVQTPEGPAQIKKIAKAVMRELEDQIRLERQRRGMK